MITYILDKEKAKELFSKELRGYMDECELRDTSFVEAINELYGQKARDLITRESIWRLKKGTCLPKQETVDILISTLIHSYEKLGKRCLLTNAVIYKEFLLLSAGRIPVNIDQECITDPIPSSQKPIFCPRDFFGQTELFQKFSTSWWMNSNILQHVAVIGERSAGKTSLLRYLENITRVYPKRLRQNQPQGWYNWWPNDFQFAYVDLESGLDDTESFNNLLAYLLRSLELPVPVPCNLLNFASTIDESKKPTIFLLDNIHSAIPKVDVDIWQAFLRSLGNNGNIGFVVTSRKPIEEWAKQCDKESPFFNVFWSIELGPLSESDARELINHFQFPLTNEERDWMISNSHGWPVLLQHFCHFYAQNKNTWKHKSDGAIIRFNYLFQLPSQNNYVNLNNPQF